MVNAKSKILIIGMSAGGAESLPVALLERITTADVLVGGRRQLGYFPDFAGEAIAITSSIEPAVQRLQQVLARGERAVVLASGDPLWYGIGASLRRVFPPEVLEIVPAPTAFQMAFAVLAEPWHDAALLSAHGRPLDDVITGVLHAPKAAILTDSQHTPAVIAQSLLGAGLPADTACAVCENLGGPEQRVIRTILGHAAGESFAALNVFVVWSNPDMQAPVPAQLSPAREGTPGLPDDAYATAAGQITKREVRLLSLAELALGPGEVLWDIGAGSGAVGIEAARSQPSAQVFAVERRAGMCVHIRENLRRFPAPNLRLVEGHAPEACAGWPDPDAVFVGGSGGKLAEIIDLARQQLRPGGRLVINLATLENLHTLRAHLPTARVVQVQINRGVPIQDMLRFEALNPIFIVTWRNADRVTS